MAHIRSRQRGSECQDGLLLGPQVLALSGKFRSMGLKV